MPPPIRPHILGHPPRLCCCAPYHSAPGINHQLLLGSLLNAPQQFKIGTWSKNLMQSGAAMVASMVNDAITVQHKFWNQYIYGQQQQPAGRRAPQGC
jgi:hypothetical protein